MDAVRSVAAALLVELSVLLVGLVLFELVSPLLALVFALAVVSGTILALASHVDGVREDLARWMFIGAALLVAWTTARMWL